MYTHIIAPTARRAVRNVENALTEHTEMAFASQDGLTRRMLEAFADGADAVTFAVREGAYSMYKYDAGDDTLYPGYPMLVGWIYRCDDGFELWFDDCAELRDAEKPRFTIAA